VTLISEKCGVAQEVVAERLALFLKNNVYQVCEPMLRDWLLPSFLPIPMLLTEVNSVLADETDTSPLPQEETQANAKGM